MTDGRHFLYAVLCGTGVLLLGGGTLVWPAMHGTSQTRHEIALLQRKIADLATQTRAVERLAEEVKNARHRAEVNLKHIPVKPDFSKIMARLHLPVDQRTVIDQSIAAGSPTDAVIGKDYPERALPLTLEMNATFDSVYAVIRAAELMDRLVRVSTVRIAATRTEERSGAKTKSDLSSLQPPSPLVAASVGFEVIYQPVENTASAEPGS